MKRILGFKVINLLPFWAKKLIANHKTLARVTGNTYWGLLNLDKSLVSIIGNTRGFFVELGANDGITQSNTKHLELFHGWKGVLVEPWPDNFSKLKQVRKSDNYFSNSACVSFDYKEQTIELLYSNLMTTPLAGASDLADRSAHALSGTKFLKSNESVSTFSAEARTLSSILTDAKAPEEIDLLSLDVEGAELEVLRGIDFSKYRFRWMLIETRDIEELSSFLTKYGYTLQKQMTSHDYLFQGQSGLR